MPVKPILGDEYFAASSDLLMRMDSRYFLRLFFIKNSEKII